MSVAGGVRPIYLTFDDGPDPCWTPRVLDLLAGMQMHATFFMIGQQARRSPALVRRVAAAGHAIGNHTYSHRHPWLMTARTARAQVRDGASALSDITGRSPQWFRPPHGRERRCMTQEARRLEERTILWDVSAIDWGALGVAARIERRLAGIAGPAVVLMHDGRNRHNRPDQLLEALPRWLARLSAQGLRAACLPAHGELT